MDQLEETNSDTSESLNNVTNNDPGGRGNVDQGQQDAKEETFLKLHQCARNGDVNRCRDLIEKMGTDKNKKINLKDEDDLTPLHYAARYGHLGVLKLLIENEADITAVDDEGLTPLHYASMFKRDNKKGAEVKEQENSSGTSEDQDSMISFLVSKGADVNVTDIYGQTPLHYAAMRGNEPELRKLLADPNINKEASDKQGMTAMHMAASRNNPEIVQRLIDKGVNIQLKDKACFTSLHAACTVGSTSIVKMLFIAGANIPSMVTDKDVDGNTCLSLAVLNGHYDVVENCLDKGADVNTPNKMGMYPLHLAAVNGDVQIVQLLVKRNARIDALNWEHATPLHKACQYNHVEVVEFLIEKPKDLSYRRADIESRDWKNFTPLLLASVYGHSAIVDLLIQNEADVWVSDKNDKSAIFLAAEENQSACLKELLNDGRMKYIINISDRYGNGPLHIAAKKGYLQVVKILLAHGADLNHKNHEEVTPFHLAAKHGWPDIIREFVTKDKNAVYNKDVDSKTALHLAALGGHAKVAKELIQKGAVVEARNENLWTPLDCAAAKGSIKTARVILEGGSPVNPMGKTKTTPLHLAAKNGHTKVVKLLIDWRADVKQRDSDGNNCLDLAINFDNSETALCIIKSNYWQEALRNYTKDMKTGRHDTPMRKLIRKMPYVAKEAVNRCMEGNKENIESENYKVTFSFEFLDDAYSMLKWGEVPSEGPYTTDPQIIKENHPLMIMVTSRRGDLLAHPIVTALLRYKWGSTSWWIYSLNILLYVLYLVSITGFVLTTDLPHKKNSTVNASTNLTNVGKQQAIPYKEFFPNGPVILFTVLHIIKEIVKMCFVKMKYFCLENLIEMVAYITSLVYVCSSEQGDSWQWNLGPVAIFLAWINVAMFVKTFRSVGIHLMMFKEVFMTFLYFFRVFALFIIAFVFAFYALLQNQDSFATFWKSLLKTTAMMTGGLDYDITYSEEEEGWMHHGISYIMFFVFMIGMNITILNLLVGLAVEDIKEIKKQAELTKTAMLVELVLEFEKILKKLPPFPRKGNVIDKRTLEPNANVGMIRNKYSKWCGLESGGPTAAAIEKAINPEVTQMEQLKQTMTKMRYNQKEVKEKINNLEGMLKSLMRHQNVPLAHEEGQETDTLSHMEVNS